MLISSKSNGQIKEYIMLKKSKKDRYKSNKFVIEGAKVCGEALNSGYEITAVYMTLSAIEKYTDLLECLNKSQIEIIEITEELSKVLGDTETPQGVYMVCKMLDIMQYIDKIKYSGKYIILENIQDPGNMGTIIRTADALGIDTVYVSADSTDIYSPKVIRSTTGSIFRQNVVIVENVAEFIRKLSNKGATTFGAVLHKDAKLLGTFEFPEFSGCVIGNEGNGMSEEAISACNSLLTIPMSKHTESLNAGLAAGIVMWEMCR